MAFASGNPIYGLILNGLKGLYTRVGRYYFSNIQAKELALAFYKKLAVLCEQKDVEHVMECVRQYGKDSGIIWQSLQSPLPSDLEEVKR